MIDMKDDSLRKSVLKIEIAGAVTSFCLPHFKQGMQPTYEMPPPSTIYGHICSAAGEWVTPENLEFGYHFVHDGKFIDYREHLHFDSPVQPFPFNRELLFRPRLTLYLSALDLFTAFQQPHFAVCLGRSQDLMTYCSVKRIELQRAQAGYFEHTLLPHWMAPQLGTTTVSVTMSRYIRPNRTVVFAPFAMIREPALWPAPAKQYQSVFGDDEDEETLLLETDPVDLWIDPESKSHPKYPERKRAVWFHRFVD
jgi:CRISPR-associated protein Cas5t